MVVPVIMPDHMNYTDYSSETVILQYMWYGEMPFQIYNDVDRAFYDQMGADGPINTSISRLPVQEDR